MMLPHVTLFHVHNADLFPSPVESDLMGYLDSLDNELCVDLANSFDENFCVIQDISF
jgi:hypothetical protein